jgi:hypothetical protein
LTRADQLLGLKSYPWLIKIPPNPRMSGSTKELEEDCWGETALLTFLRTWEDAAISLRP